MTSLFGEASTVVGGDHFTPSSKSNGGSPSPLLPVKHHQNPQHHQQQKPQPKSTEEEFIAATMDYTLEDRPFFIRIGKEGVIAALEKLDEQLVKAGRSKVLSTKIPTDWTGKEVVPGRLGLINHG